MTKDISTRTHHTHIVLGALVITATVALGTVATPVASAAPRWAPASEATIHPGVRTNVSGFTCTTNFVFYDAHAVYLGQPASCSSSASYWHCVTPGLGALVKIEGASRRGTIVYNSLLATGDACSFNNFALVRIHNDDRGRVNPSVPFWGGPTAGGGRSRTGNPVYSYGNADSPSGSTDRSPKHGVDTSTVTIDLPCDRMQPCGQPFRDGTNGGWTHYAQMVLPGAADVGAPVLDARGRAFGVLGAWAHDSSNRVTDLGKAIKYMKSKTNLDGVHLAKGTAPFLPR